MRSIIVLFVALLLSLQAIAHQPENEISALRAELSQLYKRIEILEAESQKLKTTSITQSKKLTDNRREIDNVVSDKSVSSSNQIALKGDFRYRYEYIDSESKTHRDRDRVRARFGVEASIPNDVKIGFGIASGGDNPVSSNQTLGKGNSTKDLRLDVAYLKWNFSEDAQLLAGKFSNPLYRPQKSSLLWDGDWRPEGIALSWRGEQIFANTIANWIESDSKSGNRTLFWGAQIGGQIEMSDIKLTGALAYYDFPTSGKNAFYDDDFFGNSTVEGRYAFDYQLVEIGGDMKFSLLNQPAVIFGNYVRNRDASSDDDGWLVGVGLGKVKKAKSWSLKYQYQELESDAVLGLFSDSDFAGGDTGATGHKLRGAVGITSNWSLGFTWFFDNRLKVTDQDTSVQYDRIQIDAAFKY